MNGPSGDVLPNPLAWRFMDEPLYRWMIFLIAIGLLMRAWQGVLSYMK